MARIVDLEEPAISSNGSRIAVVAIVQDLAHAASLNRLVFVDAQSGRMQTVTRATDVAVPRWSPRDQRLAYLARPSESGIAQLFVRAPSGETVQLTHALGDVIDAAWSPNAQEIAYVAADRQEPAPFFFAGDNDYTATALTPPDHLWIVPAGGGRARRLTSGSWTIAPTDPGGIFSPQIAWTHDGRHITYTRVENTFSGDDEHSTLWQIDTATRATHKLTDHDGTRAEPGLLSRRLTLDVLVSAQWRLQRREYAANRRRCSRSPFRFQLGSQRSRIGLVSRQSTSPDLRERSYAESRVESRPCRKSRSHIAGRSSRRLRPVLQQHVRRGNCSRRGARRFDCLHRDERQKRPRAVLSARRIRYSAAADALQRVSFAHHDRCDDRTQLDRSRRLCRRRRRDSPARFPRRRQIPGGVADSRWPGALEQPRLRVGGMAARADDRLARLRRLPAELSRQR